MPRPVIQLLLFAGLMIMLALSWRYLIESGFITTSRIEKLLTHVAQIKHAPWLFPAILLSYLLLLTVMFPLTILVVVTGFLFSPWWALFYATVATLCSSALSYWIGHVLGRSTIEKHSSHYLRVVSRFMQENSVHSMVVINLLPIAPFTMTNMMAGAFQLKFSRYMIGSAIGIIPGLIVVTLLGGQLNKIVSATDNQQFWGELVIAVTLISVLMAIIRWVKKKEHVDD